MKKKIIYAGVCAAAICLFVAAHSFFRVEEAVKLSDGGVPLPVLMYHQVLDDPKKLGKYVISPSELEADLALISEMGFETVTVSEVVAFCKGEGNLPKKPIMLTFDDGYRTDYLNVFPLLKKYNMKAVFSVVGAYTDRYSQNIDRHINYAHLSWEEISEMHKSGYAEFQNHSYDLHSLSPRHGCLKTAGETAAHYDNLILTDVLKAQERFATELGYEPICFTYPYGGRDEELVNLLRSCGFSATLGTYEKINVLKGSEEELYDIKRFNRAHGRSIEKILKDAE